MFACICVCNLKGYIFHDKKSTFNVYWDDFKYYLQVVKFGLPNPMTSRDYQ